jgi:hypothetical protein
MATKTAPVKRILDARRDTLDFRDQMFVPTLIEVPVRIALEDYLHYKVPVLDQGSEGACTGFGLATVANYLLRRRKVVPENVRVSPRMFYELARRYDEWPGESYSGSSARGAMKGWHKHGICTEAEWKYNLAPEEPQGLNAARASDANLRPLGAYFRVNHKDLIAMHAAISEVGVLYATATVHAGWDAVGKDGIIDYTNQITGGHAFAIVAYDDNGFWIQNSWGKRWGKSGLGRISYDDWLENATDVWVARLGAPVRLLREQSLATAHSEAAAKSNTYSYVELRPHIISIENDGRLKAGGNYGSTPAEIAQIFQSDFRRLMQIPDSGKPPKPLRLLLYAHGGLTDEESAVQRVAEYRSDLLAAGVYPLAFIWNSDYWTTITNILQDAIRRRRPEGLLDSAKDFMLDRLDDALEPIARKLTGKAAWDEMKENAELASGPDGGARLIAQHVAGLKETYPELEIHVVGHSAGAIFHAPLMQLLTADGMIGSGPLQGQTGFGLTVSSCTLWAPACTIELFKATYLPAIQQGRLERFTTFVLSDEAEQDDNCARIYNKSLLYLVSNAFEDKPRIPGFRDGVPLLGLQKSIAQDSEVEALFRGSNAELIIAPNDEAEGDPDASGARHHGDFDDDRRTVMATFTRIAPQAAGQGQASGGKMKFHASRRSLSERRANIDRQTKPLRMN